MPAKPSRKPKSLVEFVRAKRRVGCKLCALPEVIRAELAAARTKKIPRTLQLEWIKAEHRIVLTIADFDSHFSGKHEQ